ncbi:MAG: hypothetical protein UY32_C0028G0009 [Candidatus Jorgensenbacteria bacterium GW2011_GWC1_48_8]|uniref:Uncharacterized protein n=1 Tax=Candidatus Jorgensenbacteria bacterium GW2011_GWC1_48_8 TaxID=1618666 RepID=A0A0G1XVK6_9BACT|nr:MAG: hypothetical protein UY32_C0028G0009 [Candidatus Jorgensenbacteria bacterium GW2011_GWC1_48_8]
MKPIYGENRLLIEIMVMYEMKSTIEKWIGENFYE